MATVTYVNIEQLGGRKKPIQIEFNPTVNVLWGVNGSGKTSILKVLHSALAGDATPLLRLNFSSAEVGISDVQHGQVVRTLSSEAMESLQRKRARRPNSALIREDPAYQQATLFDEARTLGWETSPVLNRPAVFSHRYLPISRVSEFKSRWGRSNRSAVQDILDEAQYDRVFADQIRDLWGEHQSDSRVQVQLAQQSALAEIISTFLELNEGGDDVSPSTMTGEEAQALVSEFVSGQTMMRRRSIVASRVAAEYDSSPQIRKIVATVQNVKERIDAAQSSETRFFEVVNESLGKGKRLQPGENTLSMKVARGPRDGIPLEHFSSGEKQLVRLLVEALVATRHAILVDEPEISLHVDWQASLLSGMNFVNPRAQVIAATHSPEVLTGIDPDARFEV